MTSRFFTSYHPFLPFLDPKQTPDEYLSKSSLLFWTIAGVAARRYERDVSLLRKLSSCVTKLAWEVISTRGNQLTTIQSLLLLCTWPFPTCSLLLESTPVWGDIALSMATQLGLYQPDQPGYFSRLNCISTIPLQTEKVRTWLACTIVAHKSVDTAWASSWTIANFDQQCCGIRIASYNAIQFCSYRINQRRVFSTHFTTTEISSRITRILW